MKYDEELERLRNVRDAAWHLIEDVKRRYPGEEFKCPYMRALDRAVTETKV